MLLEKSDVVQGDVAIDELENNCLCQQMVGMLRVCPVVLTFGQDFRNIGECVVQDLNNYGIDDHEPHAAAMLVKDSTEVEERSDDHPQANNRNRQHCVTEDDPEDSLAPRVVTIDASSDRVDAASPHETWPGWL